jgi:release factor glutamine methyltransferase
VVVSTLRAAGCVFAEEEARLLISEARARNDLFTMMRQRAEGLPLEQVLGWAEFCGLRIAVDPGVFVPRLRTELLARQATALAARITDRPPIVVDLCCGSGAVAAALAASLDSIELYAADIEPAAVRCARRNLGSTRVFEGDLYEPLPRALAGRIDVLIANAPYVPTAAIGLLPAEARLHEPWVALDGGTDGLDVLHRVIAEAVDWLAPGGSLLVESSDRQASLIVETCDRSGLVAGVAKSDELAATVVIGSKPVG